MDNSTGNDTSATPSTDRKLAQQYTHLAGAPDLFFAAWKRGVELAGPHLFGEGPVTNVDRAKTIWDLCPKVALIERAIDPMRSSEKSFLAALVSFYNAEDGRRIFERIGIQRLADLGGLDLPRRAVIASLILNYTGW